MLNLENDFPFDYITPLKKKHDNITHPPFEYVFLYFLLKNGGIFQLGMLGFQGVTFFLGRFSSSASLGPSY